MVLAVRQKEDKLGVLLDGSLIVGVQNLVEPLEKKGLVLLAYLRVFLGRLLDRIPTSIVSAVDTLTGVSGKACRSSKGFTRVEFRV